MPTIREYLKTRNQRMKYILWTELALLLVYLLIMGKRITHLEQMAIAFFGAIVAALIAMPFASERVLCPACGKRIGKLPRAARIETAAKLYSPEGLDVCPHCGTSFDQPWPQ